MTQEPIEAEVVSAGSSLAPQEKPDTSMRPIDYEEFSAWAETRAKALNKLMEMGIAQTSPGDWSDMGGKPHPEQGACSSIINMVGIQIDPPARRKETFEDEKGNYYIYFLESQIRVPRFGIGPLAIVGRASSRDPFFAFRQGELRPQSEIDPGDILAKAYTNLRFRAVKAVNPEIAGMTWERLKELTGGRVQKGAVKQVHYGDKEQEEIAKAGSGNCPSCGQGNIVLKEGDKNGKHYKFYGCDRYPDCKHTQKEPQAKKESAPPQQTDPNDKAPLIAALESFRKAQQWSAAALFEDMTLQVGKKITGYEADTADLQKYLAMVCPPPDPFANQ